jgi:hypothetical protein
MREGDTVKIGDEEFEVIHTYSRAQAIEDGVLVDVSGVAPDLVKNAGITLPIAMTRAVWDQYVVVPDGVLNQDLKGRLWDILWLFRCAAKNFEGEKLLFQVYVRNDNRKPKLVTLKAVCGPGDDATPVIAIMLPDQD